MDPEINLKLHQHVWDILVDLAVDETFSDQEAADVTEAMGDLAEMLIDSLDLEVLEVKETGASLELVVSMFLKA